MTFHEHPLCKKLGLAREALELVRGEDAAELPGVRESLRQERGVEVHTVEVLNKTGARLLHKPPGHYLTCTMLDDETDERAAAVVISRLLTSLLPQMQFSSDRPLLLVGLGNEEVRPDALGPAVVRHTYATRQLLVTDALPGWEAVCTLAPGVLGLTGIDTAEVVAGVCARLRPGAVVAVDSLATADISRLGVTVQLSDTGICPGSGLGGGSSELDRKSLGCPVVALGVPTVADVSALINSVCAALDDRPHAAADATADTAADTARQQERELVLQHLSEQSSERLLITARGIEDLIERMARLLAAALALVVHPDCREDNLFEFIR